MSKETADDNLSSALEFIAHYHTCHTQDKVTRFVDPDNKSAPVIYVISDLDCRKKVADVLGPEFTVEII